ncbi:PIN domain-like protein [Hyaloraphidium curvatum]|nr:PIN domain-like protein [Hyaloraphidium curvatum]
MGIAGLLPLLREAARTVPLDALRGLTVGVDAYVWLHRGAYGCAADLATGRRTTRYVDYCLEQVRRLQSFGIVPYLVFDGGPLPAKRATEAERRLRREEARAKGMELWHAGQRDRAFEHFAASVDVSPAMAFQLIAALRKLGVAYVVAPYEADAQLAYLEKAGIVDAILTEDSDLLVFGCKRVLYKLDRDSTVQEILRSRFSDVRAEIALGGKFTDEKFRWMCILSGCDYLPSIPNLGLKKAYKLLVRCSSVEMALRTGSFTYRFQVPKDYLAAFRRAELTFLHQRVWCPRARRLVHLADPPPGLDLAGAEHDYLGRDLPPEVAAAIAGGDLCPVTGKVLGTVEEGVVLPPLPSAVGGRGAEVLVPGSDDEPAAAEAEAVAAEAACAEVVDLEEERKRTVKAITARTVVDARTRSPFFGKPPAAAGGAAPAPLPASQLVPASQVDKPRRVITLKRLNDENEPHADAAPPAEPIVLGGSPSPERKPRSAPPAAGPADEDADAPKAEERDADPARRVLKGMLDRYRVPPPTLPLAQVRARPGAGSGQRNAGPPRLNLQGFTKSFPAYDFLHKPLQQSPKTDAGDGAGDAGGASNAQPAWSSQPVLPTQNHPAKRKRQSAPLPRAAASQPAGGKRASLSAGPRDNLTLTSGWFAGWQPTQDTESAEP